MPLPDAGHTSPPHAGPPVATTSAPARGAAEDDRQLRVRQAHAGNAAAALLFEEQRYDEAIPAFEQALSACRAALGPQHPATLIVAGNLAVARFSAGQHDEGLSFVEANLAARVHILGNEHPDTLTARAALATACRTAGDVTRAVKVAEEVALQRSRQLGGTHPDTLTSRVGLALALAAAGNAGRAKDVLTAALADAELVHGPDHHHTRALGACVRASGLINKSA